MTLLPLRVGSPGAFAWKGIFAGAAAGTALGLLGFFLTYGERSGRQVGMGFALFFAVPLVAGFVLALLSPSGTRGTGVSVLSLFFTLIILISLGREGALCAALCLPLVIANLAAGIAVGLLVKGVTGTSKPTTTVMMLFAAPLVMLGARQTELNLAHYDRAEEITNSVLLNASPDEVWDKIGNIDEVAASKPFLMYVGLPVPVRCTLQGKGVGAKRTCYFETGRIEETVTLWNPPYRMDLKIDRTAMPGRHWLGFEKASYQLSAQGTQTLLTRNTVITSNLAPAHYWRIFERLGVSKEHEYIFRDLERRLSK